MKKVLQFVAVVVIGLMALQPALGALPCMPAAHVPCMESCPMADATMDCPMAHSTAMQGCPPECCRHSRSETLAPAAVLAKFGAPATGDAIWVSAVAVQTPAVVPSRASRQAPATSPPRYKLFRVFRI